MQLSQLIEKVDRSLGGVVVRKQTTYVDIAVDCQTFRVNYHLKREFSFASDTFRSIYLHTKHPLLMEYVEPMVPVHLASQVDDKAKFRKLLEDAATEVFGKWRSVDRYLNLPLEEFLEKPYGLLMTAPETFARIAAKRAEDGDIRLILHNGHTQSEYPQALVLDENYVIADEFRVELLQKVETSNA